MPTHQRNNVLSHLRYLAMCSDSGEISDGQLLERFLSRNDQAAFEVLVQRHGAMVLGVCRRVLQNEADAEDAFQATFLVLVRKAASLRACETIAGWLYHVACRTSMNARRMSARRKSKEMQVQAMSTHDATVEQDLSELQEVLDQELEKLPEKHRAALVLCELEGVSRKDAARQLKIPEGTLSSRLARGRSMLARRLTQRGVALSASALVTVLAQSAASACPSRVLMVSTIQAAMNVAAGQAATGVVSAKVAALMEGVMKMMLLKKLKAISVVLLLVGFLGLGSAPLLVQATAQDQKQVTTKQNNKGTSTANVQNKEKSDQERIQGVWLPVRIVKEGRQLNPQDRLNPPIKFVFSAKKVVVTAADSSTKEMTYRLDPSKSPKWLDLYPDGNIGKAIYELKGDTLKIVIEDTGKGGRPTAFVSQPGTDNDLLMVFKRAPKGKAKGSDKKATAQDKKQLGAIPKKPVKTLSGTWIVQSAIRNGKEFEQPRGSSLTFADGTVTIRTKQKKQVMGYQFDLKKKPMHLTFINKKEIVKGIIEIKGNMMRICTDQVGAARPKNFEAAANSPAQLLTLKKQATTKQDNKGKSAAKAQPKGKSDKKLIQGTWLAVRVEDGGRKIGKNKVEGAKFIFSGKKAVLKVPGRPDREMTYRLDPNKSPKWIVFDKNGKVNLGIYQLMGDTLKIVIDESGKKGRPNAFVSQPGTANDLLMVFKRAPKGKGNQPTDKKQVRIPGAVPLKFDQAIQFEAAAGPIQQGNKKFYLIHVRKGKFHLSNESRLTAELKAAVAQYARVDFWIYAAVFDAQGNLLGTASHKEEVQYMRLGITPTLFRDIQLDFGINKAFNRAAYVVVTISEREVPMERKTAARK